jgi:hypothetical protein
LANLSAKLDRFWTKTLEAFEPRVGDYLYDRGIDGSECRWARVLAYESPHRTRVEIEHRKIERHGEGWEGVRDGVDGARGWPLYLARYADLVAQRD